MIRLGMLDFDTSHSVEFAKRINHVGIAEDQWVHGAKIVIACPGQSRMMPERIPQYRQEMVEIGIPLVENPEEMIGQVDGMMIEAVQGSAHWERTKPFLDARLPCFVDKPFACNVADARKLVQCATENHVPIFSSSALRYAPELVKFLDEPGHGKVVGAFAFGPAILQPGNPGLFHYGIHAVETLYTIMGCGCKEVVCTHDSGVDVATGRWLDSRVGTVRGIRDGKNEYGCVVFAENGIHTIFMAFDYLYRELLKKVIEMFETNKPPVEPAETVEIMAFLEAALRSENNQGRPASVDVNARFPLPNIPTF